MNSPLVRWLLDLEAIPQDASGLRLVWEHGWAGWVWSLLAAGAAILAFWSYQRISGSRSGRGALAAIRTATLVMALVIIAGPMLELPRETIEPDWVMMLVDRSESMTVADANEAGRRVSRDDQLRTIIDGASATWTELAAEREVRWLGFHSGAFTLAGTGDRAGDAPADFGVADGDQTRLGASLEQAIQRAAARPVSGLVIFSDGRTSDPPSRALLRNLMAEAIPVFVVPLGSPVPLGDLAVRRVDAPRRAFVRDKVPVVVEIDRLGSAGQGLDAEVLLVDEQTGKTLDRVELKAGDGRNEVTFTAEPALAGEATWKVVINTAEQDLVPDNNSKQLMIELVDRPLRVLYVEGYPRWEYRYLKNLLVREKSIECSVMLLSADRDFAQEGNKPITRLPRSPEELAKYDVLVLGDAPASFFSPDQLDLMRQHVSDRGAGLLWIAGERYTPSSYSGTPLADLLPMRGGLKLPIIDKPTTVQPTVLAERLGVLNIIADGPIHGEASWPRQLMDPSFGWSQLYAAQRIEPGRLKPTAEVLAETAGTVDGVKFPLVVHMRFGAGQSIYVATDEIWRWRYGRGELLPDQFWIQMIRMLGRKSLSASGLRADLVIVPRRIEVNQPSRMELRLLDAQLLDPRRTSVTAVLEEADGRKIADIELRRLPDVEDRFAATYLPEVTGELRVRVTEPEFASLDLQAVLEVYAPDDELRRPESDHKLLADLAASTGGRVLGADEVEQLPELLPNRAVRTLNPLRERIWDTPLAFCLVLLALTAEWIGRKILRLV